MLRGVTLAALAAFSCAVLVPAAAASGPLRTGIVDPASFLDPGAEDANFDRARSTGSTVVKLLLHWRQVAPAGPAKPEEFDPTDPADPAYSAQGWARFDKQVVRATERGLEPLVYVYGAPAWAEGLGPGAEGVVRPDPVEFGHFARAAATRYGGAFVPSGDPDGEPLPRVRYWQAWNEPNRNYFFMPQYENGAMVSPKLYRALVNRFATAVRSVHSTNLVVAGGLAPLGRPGKPAPLAFMRAFLSASVSFDVWAHHPYTSGGPTRKAAKKNDVSLGDLPAMRQALRAAVRTGRVKSSRPVAFWVTEFSWDAKPVDPKGVPAAIHARWVSEALYRMWVNGVSLVVWFKIRDDPLHLTPYQSGFYTVAGKQKRSLTAYRFPVVALRTKTGIRVWGRTPYGAPGQVQLQVKSGGVWRPLGKLRANAHGIFRKTYGVPYRKGSVRARFAGETSLPFGLKPVKDRYVNPFGCGGPIRC